MEELEWIEKEIYGNRADYGDDHKEDEKEEEENVPEIVRDS